MSTFHAQVTVTPIGIVRSTQTRNQNDDWDSEKVFVELDQSQFSPEALAGLADFRTSRSCST
jgi:tRNA (adenine37-N6)-methyltransferase